MKKMCLLKCVLRWNIDFLGFWESDRIKIDPILEF